MQAPTNEGLFVVWLVASVLTGCSAAMPSASIPHGVYVPKPGQAWFAGERIRVDSGRFAYQRFTDNLSELPLPVTTGVVRRDGDHFVFEANGRVFDTRVLTRNNGQVMLWKIDAFMLFRDGKPYDDLGVLYLNEGSIQSSEPTLAPGGSPAGQGRLLP